MQHIETVFEHTIQDLFGLEVKVVFTRPDEQFGDLATNVALHIAKQIGVSPREVATRITDAAKDALGADVSDITVAGPGFINVTLSDNELLGRAQAAAAEKPQIYQDKLVVAEYSDPNPFKAFHAGHFYTTVVGDAIARLVQAAGAKVHRVNFGGDVGLHVGKAMWAIVGEDMQKALENLEVLAAQPLHDRATWMAECYVKGNTAYDEDETAKAQIIGMNKKVYLIHEQDDHTSTLAKIYHTCRDWSYEYFDAFYQELGVDPFEKYYPESQTTPVGLATVKEQLAQGVYKKSNGAIVFDGEQFGLHTRVFINSEGLPTYEAKDVGLIMAKWHDYRFDLSLIITGNDIVEYMKVVLKSVEQFMPELPPRTRHLTHGMLKLEGGAKMSSRKGNVLYANDILQAAETAAKGDKQTAYAAVKYALLKQRTGGDIIYNPSESVALEGNSGPYVQYAHARARSILAKANRSDPGDFIDFEPSERSLARKITEYPTVLEKAVTELMPHHICTYLYELAQTFNRFYEQSRVIGDEREALRLQLVHAYADVLKDGLSMLHIPAPEHL
ncbi:MAG TPA: arginine--tRNA ligase [Magnetospirillaceae bacterium]|nr:arginine--tRNA ligase [Magnetospirillaceae bacterium]